MTWHKLPDDAPLTDCRCWIYMPALKLQNGILPAIWDHGREVFSDIRDISWEQSEITHWHEWTRWKDMPKTPNCDFEERKQLYDIVDDAVKKKEDDGNK